MPSPSEKREELHVVPDANRPGKGIALECGGPASARVLLMEDREPGLSPIPASVCSGVERRLMWQPHFFLQAMGLRAAALLWFCQGSFWHLYLVPCSPRPWLRPYFRPNKLPEPSTCPDQPHFHGSSRRSCCHTLAWGLCPLGGHHVACPSSLPCADCPQSGLTLELSVSWTVSLIPT